MKVAQINTFASGSTGKLAGDIHSMLLAQGYDVYAFFLMGHKDYQSQT